MRFPLLVLVVAMTAALVGCVQAEPEPTPTPTPSATFEPVFESEAEALAAAEALYAEYLKISDQIAAEGGAGPERIAQFVSPELLEGEIDGFDSLQAEGLHSTGATRYDNFRAQSYREFGDYSEIAAYVCLDISEVRFLNAAGEDVTPDRLEQIQFELGFRAESAEDIVLTKTDVWGSGVC